MDSFNSSTSDNATEEMSSKHYCDVVWPATLSETLRRRKKLAVFLKAPFHDIKAVLFSAQLST